MNDTAFVNRVVADGIAAARESYARPNQLDKLNGAIDGFNACRGLDAAGLSDLLLQANVEADQARSRKVHDFWYWRCRAAEVEWVANVLSAARLDTGLPVLVPPTARGMLKATEILGVRRAA